ncbi:unnamed protein product [Pseudo-nitzschia multistriata]|uniref:Fe2OG dioxygenase domain-containing protein n=1 Tax=Pseudo-nitzschia multistriata TaxID=183589 RepID=A0A448YWX3_9STRA|nr:unnamed protein product [Pseudo-nitzschia multistriata]
MALWQFFVFSIDKTNPTTYFCNPSFREKAIEQRPTATSKPAPAPSPTIDREPSNESGPSRPSTAQPGTTHSTTTTAATDPFRSNTTFLVPPPHHPPMALPNPPPSGSRTRRGKYSLLSRRAVCAILFASIGPGTGTLAASATASCEATTAAAAAADYERACLLDPLSLFRASAGSSSSGSPTPCLERESFGAFVLVGAGGAAAGDDSDDNNEADAGDSPAASGPACTNLDGDEECEAMAAPVVRAPGNPLPTHQCLMNPSYMLERCARSCYSCFALGGDDGTEPGAECGQQQEQEQEQQHETRVSIGVGQVLPEASSVRGTEVLEDWEEELSRRGLPSFERAWALLTEEFYSVATTTAGYMAGTVFANNHDGSDGDNDDGNHEFDDDDDSFAAFAASLHGYGPARRSCRNYDPLCTFRVAMARVLDGLGDENKDEDGGPFQNSYCSGEPRAAQLCGPACGACHELVLTGSELQTYEDCLTNETLDAFVESKEDDENDEDQDEENPPQPYNNVSNGRTIDDLFRRVLGELPYGDGEDRSGLTYTPTVLSRPSIDVHKHSNRPLSEVLSNGNGDGPPVLLGGPWIVVLDGFLTDEECDALIQQGDSIGREQSTIEDDLEDEEEEQEENGDSESEPEPEWRTSTTAWCQESCVDDPVVQRIQRKIGLTTGVLDEDYYENLQVLRYVPGQYYNEHHDEEGDQHDEKFLPDGPRVLTFFLYLNDVEDGGETRFTDVLGDGTGVYVDVKPKKGRSLLWPSMLSGDLLAYDVRTFHAALEVRKGTKHAANAWLHLRDYRNCPCAYDDLEELKEKLLDDVMVK